MFRVHRVTCRVCGKSLKNQRNLKKHIRRSSCIIVLPASNNIGDLDQDCKRQNMQSDRQIQDHEEGTEEALIHLQFSPQETPLKKLKKRFYAKTLEACQQIGSDSGSWPMFKDIVILEGTPTLRLDGKEYVDFFTQIIQTVEALQP